MKIVLASTSRNRQELLNLAHIPYSVIPSKIDESQIRHADPRKQVLEIARAKAKAVVPKVKHAAIIGADTIGLYREEVLEKPKFKMDAVERLKQLSGRSHVIITGWVVINTLTDKTSKGISETRVTFRDLSEQEIIDYANDYDVVTWCAGYSPFNTRAISFIEKIQGSLTSFTHGLPLEDIVPVLKEFDLL